MRRQVFKVGINPTIIDKPNRSSVNHATDWEKRELRLDALVASIKLGNAFSAHFKDGYRATKNFLCSDVIAADIDAGWTIEEMLAQDFVRSHAAFLYTTPSHTPEQHRFRVVFLLDRTITAASEWADALKGLGRKLNADRSVKDAARLFYGSSNGEFNLIGNTLSDPALDDLIEMGRLRPAPSTRFEGVGSQRSSLSLQRDTRVLLSTGESASLSCLAPLTSVMCPYHLDRHHSAFVVRSANGNSGVHCMACSATFWAGDAGEYDFEAFDKLFEQRRLAEEAGHWEAVERTTHPFEGMFSLEDLFPLRPSIRMTHDRYLRSAFYAPGITLVKSPKGSGKTAALAGLVNEINSRRYVQEIERGDRSKSALLIGHRQALIREATRRLGLECYLDHDKSDFPPDLYGICLDSLPALLGKPDNPKYDLVLIDESEQVFAHLLSETIASRRGVNACYHALHYFVRTAKAVVALDADLGMVTAHALRTMRGADWESSCRIIYNKPPIDPAGKVLLLYKKRGELIADLMRSVSDGKRCFVTCNSKKLVEQLSEMIKREFNGEVCQLSITSDNSRDDDVIEFLKRVKERVLDVQVLLASPSLGSGIDISFPDGASMIDCVYGFFVANVNTHTDIDQQLARVRNPGSVCVWISPQKLRYETNVDVIKDDLARANVVPWACEGYDDDGRVRYNKDHPLLLIYTHVVCARRASKNNLLKLFWALREAQGWRVERVKRADAAKAGNRQLRGAKESLEERRISAVMSARRLSDEEFNELRGRMERGESLDQEKRAAHEKGLLERSLGTDVSPEILGLNKDGRLLARVATFASLKSQYNDLFVGGLASELSRPGTERRLHKTSVPHLITLLAYVSGLIKNNDLDAEARVSRETLGKFVSVCRKNKTIIEEIIGDELREDIGERAVMQLSKFLEFAGLKLASCGRKTRDGVQTREYRLDAGRLALMSKLASGFRPIESWLPSKRPWAA